MFYMVWCRLQGDEKERGSTFFCEQHKCLCSSKRIRGGVVFKWVKKIPEVTRVLLHFRNCAGHFFAEYSYPFIDSVPCMKVFVRKLNACTLMNVSSTRGSACPPDKKGRYVNWLNMLDFILIWFYPYLH